MPLTEKEKRIITSPLSFSAKQRKTTKHRTRKKIQEILHDMQFLIENNSKVYDIFGIDVLYKGTLSENLSIPEDVNNEIQSPENRLSEDPDLL